MVAYGWDALGRREKTIYPDQSEVVYQYDRGGRLEKVRSSSGETRYAYDSLGRLSRRVLPNDIATEYTYSPLNRLEGLVHRRADEAVDEFHYRYDPAGNITEIEKHRSGLEVDSGVFQYAYDPLGRLVEAAHGDSRKEYRYDSLGNRVASLQNGTETRHHYNARNQLIRTEEAGAATEYGYDRRGNLTRVTENGAVKSSYVFDAANRMTEAVVADKGRAEYAYNGFLGRVKRLEELRTSEHNPADPCQEMRYILDMTLPYNNLLMTEGQRNQSFVWGNELLAAQGEENFHYLQDHLGSPIRLLGEDGTGAPLAYDEFGVPLVGVGESKANPFGFTGYQMDGVSGLYYAQARYYEPNAASFVSEDIVHDGMNYYQYCKCNPLRFIDLNGLWGKDVHYDDTYRWARTLGFSKGDAARIAYYNDYTDNKESGIDPLGWINGTNSNQSYHFNRNIDGVDSREQHATDRYNSAVAKSTEAMRLLEEAEQYLLSNGSMLSQGAPLIDKAHQLKLEALQDLGHGLHALQDIDAHGQIDANDGDWGLGHAAFLAVPDDIYRDWLGEGHVFVTLKGKQPSSRYLNTKMQSLIYMANFLNEMGVSGCES